MKEHCELLDFDDNVDGITCKDVYDCCDCGGNNCGCRYCWSCNACDNCKKSREDFLNETT